MSLPATIPLLGARLAAVAAAVAVFLGACALLHHGFYAHRLAGDTPVYKSYGERVRQGQVPYRDFFIEYPPGSLAAFLPPTFVGSYRTSFAILMAAFGALAVVLVALVAGPWALAYVAISPLLVGSILLNRYDLWPALLTTAAVVALVHDRHRLGWAALGGAVAAKVFPAVLIPLAAVWTLRRRGRGELARAAATGLAVAAVAFVPFLVVAAGEVWNSLWYQASRPLQIESLGAAVLMTFHRAGRAYSHGSDVVTGVAVRPLELLLAVAQIGTLLLLWVAFARGRVDAGRFLRFSAACLCAFVAFDKVLSPQFMIWLVPIVLLVRGRDGLRATVVLTVALLLTQVWTPTRYEEYAYHYRFAWVVLLRDLTLVGLVAVLAWPELRSLRFGRLRG